MTPEMSSQTTIWEADVALNDEFRSVTGIDRSLAIAKAFSFLRERLDHCNLPDELSQQIEADLAILCAEGTNQLIPAIRSLSEAANPLVPDYMRKIEAWSHTLHKLCGFKDEKA